MNSRQKQRADIIAKAINVYCPSVVNAHFEEFLRDYQAELNTAIDMDAIIHNQAKLIEELKKR